MDGLRADTSASHSNTALMGAEQNGVPSFEGSSVGDKSKGKGKPFCSAPKGVALSDHDQPGACPKKIHEWTDRANISFEYTKKKIDDLLKKAKKKMADSFPGESEMRKHYHSEEHLAKVREKSESKTLGDLKTFARVRQFILSRISGPPAKQPPVTLQGQTAANLLSDQPSSPAAANELQLGHSFDVDEICAGFADDGITKYAFPPLDSTLHPNEEEMDIEGLHDKKDHATDITKLQEKVDRLQRENGDLKQHNKQQEEENRKLKEENRKMREQLEQIKIEMSPECLQQIVVEVKKNETKGDDLKKGDLGYEFENDKYYKIMYVLERPYSSVRELVANLVTCSVKLKRKCGSYGERQSNGGRNEEEKASKKRKRADEAKM